MHDGSVCVDTELVSMSYEDLRETIIGLIKGGKKK